jgi:hypothetical protein
MHLPAIGRAEALKRMHLPHIGARNPSPAVALPLREDAMGNAGWWRLAAIVALLTACGPSSPSAAVTSPTAAATPTASPSGSPAPAPGACDATHRCLALVTLRGSNTLVVRDVTDIDHPTSVGNVSGVAAPAAPVFISQGELSYADANTLYRMPLSGSPKTAVAGAALDLGLFAWSPDGATAGYVAADGLHLLKGGVDRTLGHPLPAATGYGCESQACADSWDSRLAFSPDGSVVSMLVESGPVTGFALWTSDGRVLTPPASTAPTMSVWSGHSFYFRDTGGVEVWRDGVTSRFLPGVQWVRPKGSPAGGQIVYEVRDGSGLAHVYVVGTDTKNARELKAGRSEPVFLTSRYVWYRGERLCVASDQCVTGPTIETGKTYIYDLQTGVEYGSVITNVYDVWPHAA